MVLMAAIATAQVVVAAHSRPPGSGRPPCRGMPRHGLDLMVPGSCRPMAGRAAGSRRQALARAPCLHGLIRPGMWRSLVQMRRACIGLPVTPCSPQGHQGSTTARLDLPPTPRPPLPHGRLLSLRIRIRHGPRMHPGSGSRPPLVRHRPMGHTPTSGRPQATGPQALTRCLPRRPRARRILPIP